MRHVLVLAALLFAYPAQAQVNHHNIVLVILDDISTQNIDIYNTSVTNDPPTPNIDALAAVGIRFNNFWVYPACSPFRASLLTGTYPQRHGVGANVTTSVANSSRSEGLVAGVTTIASALHDAGYRTEALGKMHVIGYDTAQNVADFTVASLGFDTFKGQITGLGSSLFGNGSGTSVSYEKCTDTGSGATCAEETDYHTTDIIDDAITCIQGTEPFFCYVALHAAHKPFHKPTDSLHSYENPGLGGLICTDGSSSDELACYKAMIEAADTEIGRLVNHADFDTTDTTICVMSDNGTPEDTNVIESPEVTGKVKNQLFEGGLDGILVCSGKGVPPQSYNTAASGLANSTDIFATVMELAGLSTTALDSVSLVPIFEDSTATVRTELYVELFRPTGLPAAPNDSLRNERAVRGPQYKMKQDFDANPDTEECYDLDADPTEASPIAVSNCEHLRATLEQFALDPSATQSIPALSVWGVLLLEVLLLGSGLLALAAARRRAL